MIKRTQIRIKPDPEKVIVKSLNFGDPVRVEPVIRFIKGLSEQEISSSLEAIKMEFSNRHYDLDTIFFKNYETIVAPVDHSLSSAGKMLAGAYFTHEYSVEASALFNPSIVPHPDQDEVEEGALRFLLSLRAVGEGHISSVAFMEGLVSSEGEITISSREKKLSTGERNSSLRLDKNLVLRQIREEDPLTRIFNGQLQDHPTEEEVIAVLSKAAEYPYLPLDQLQAEIRDVFDANYDIHFPGEIPLGGRILFPQSRAESNGMEDVRFVRFEEDVSVYYGTYTAYNGRSIQPHLIRTHDFRHFEIRVLSGKAATNKGMALFPQKINGRYAMVGRQDGRNITIMYSENLLNWDDYELLQAPERGWEMLQLGNCGSPVRTEAGWLLLTHAVGPMRKYVLSFTLLDLDDPGRIIASMEQPFMEPNEEEREGYVPNVLYTCGLLQHRGKLIIPYAMSDSSISFAVAETEEVLERLATGNK